MCKKNMRAKFYKVIPHSKNRACNYIFLDFGKLTFVKQSPLVLDGEQQLQKRKIEKEKFITHRPWRKYTTCLEELHGKPKEEAGRMGEPRVHAIITVPTWSVLGALKLDPGCSIQIKTSKV